MSHGQRLVGRAASHKFRIEWNSSTVAFYLDDVQMYTHSFALFINLRPSFSDTVPPMAGCCSTGFAFGPYAASGTFTSRVIDARAPVSMGPRRAGSATVPTGTTLVVKVRTGNTATPDATWSAYATFRLRWVG